MSITLPRVYSLSSRAVEASDLVNTEVVCHHCNKEWVVRNKLDLHRQIVQSRDRSES